MDLAKYAVTRNIAQPLWNISHFCCIVLDETCHLEIGMVINPGFVLREFSQGFNISAPVTLTFDLLTSELFCQSFLTCVISGLNVI